MASEQQTPVQRTPAQTVVRHEERLSAAPRTVARERVTVSVRTATSSVQETVVVRREMLTVESVDGRPVPGLAAALAALSGAGSRVVGADGAADAPGRAAAAPQSAGEAGGGAAGASFVLHEERPVAGTQVRPYERVRVERVAAVEQVPVTEPVRTEHVEVDGDGLPAEAREGSAR